jgi:hypothetical protein
MARSYYALMTADEVKDTIPEISDAIPNELINDNVKISQQMKIRPILGYSFYEELETQISASTVSTNNQYILDEYLYMVLSLNVQKRLTMTQSFQLENNGLRTKLSDVSDLAQTTDLSYYRSDLQNDIDFLTNEMIKYIETVPENYPQYITRTDVRDDTDSEGRRRYNYGFSLGAVQNDNWKLR